MNELIREIQNCKICHNDLPLGANPILSVGKESKIMIIGQAPGIRVHHSGIPWNDPSGDNLRKWLDIDKSLFYNTRLISIMPMGFCYPGTGNSGDLPPRKECAPKWHQDIFNHLPNIQFVLLVGQYAQNFYLKNTTKKNLTETVQSYSDYLPQFFPLPHPSPRNNIWQKKNPWFMTHVVPTLQLYVKRLISQ